MDIPASSERGASASGGDAERSGAGPGGSGGDSRSEGADSTTGQTEHRINRPIHRERSSSSMSELENELAELNVENKRKPKTLLSRQR